MFSRWQYNNARISSSVQRYEIREGLRLFLCYCMPYAHVDYEIIRVAIRVVRSRFKNIIKYFSGISVVERG